MCGAVNRAPNNASEFGDIALTTGECGLVRTVITAYPKLVERLGRLCSMLRLSSLSPPENSVFDGNNSLRAFCIFCKSLGYRVVHAGCDALFFVFAILRQSLYGDDSQQYTIGEFCRRRQ